MNLFIFNFHSDDYEYLGKPIYFETKVIERTTILGLVSTQMMAMLRQILDVRS